MKVGVATAEEAAVMGMAEEAMAMVMATATAKVSTAATEEAAATTAAARTPVEKVEDVAAAVADNVVSRRGNSLGRIARVEQCAPAYRLVTRRSCKGR